MIRQLDRLIGPLAPIPRAAQPERSCCDGLCSQGRDCPAICKSVLRPRGSSLAPGVIDGPHQRPRLAQSRRFGRAAQLLIAFVLAVVSGALAGELLLPLLLAMFTGGQP